MRSNDTPVDTINIKALLAREELAIAKETARLELMANITKYKYDNTKWELLSFSSEEPTGENKDGVHNGLAKLIIDGDNDTY